MTPQRGGGWAVAGAGNQFTAGQQKGHLARFAGGMKITSGAGKHSNLSISNWQASIGGRRVQRATLK